MNQSDWFGVRYSIHFYGWVVSTVARNYLLNRMEDIFFIIHEKRKIAEAVCDILNNCKEVSDIALKLINSNTKGSCSWHGISCSYSIGAYSWLPGEDHKTLDSFYDTSIFLRYSADGCSQRVVNNLTVKLKKDLNNVFPNIYLLSTNYTDKWPKGVMIFSRRGSNIWHIGKDTKLLDERIYTWMHIDSNEDLTWILKQYPYSVMCAKCMQLQLGRTSCSEEEIKSKEVVLEDTPENYVLEMDQRCTINLWYNLSTNSNFRAQVFTSLGGFHYSTYLKGKENREKAAKFLRTWADALCKDSSN